jgi:hypothetical protein
MHQQLGTSPQVIWLAGNAPVVLDVHGIASHPFACSESVALFVQGLQAAQRLDSLTVVHIITDLSPHDTLFSQLSQACTDIPFQVHSV